MYTLTESKRTGKTLKQSVRRGLYVQVDFGENGPCETDLKDRALTEIRDVTTYTNGQYWRTKETQFIPANLDLTFVVKYGGPNAIVREILTKLRNKQQARLDVVQRKVDAMNNSIQQLDKVLKGDKDETE